MNKKKFIKSLIKTMTLQEKIGQLNQLGGSIYETLSKDKLVKSIENGQVGSILSVTGAKKINEIQKIAMERTRLKIPILFAQDIIHGIKTIFPTPLAESCSWDFELAKKTADMAAYEGAALGIKWTFAPMVDICRDIRWGRIIEGAGEDTMLSQGFAKARVEGFQGDLIDGKIDKNHLLACCKHFVGYGACEAGKDYNSTQISEYNLNNVYFPAFKEGVNANVKSIMTSFNELNGVPCSGNKNITNKILRKQWGFKGIIVSDWKSILELIAHGYAKDRKECAYLAIKSLINIDMAGEIYIENISQLLKEKKIKISEINNLVEEVLEIKYSLNLFEKPYVDEQREKTEILTDKAKEMALESAKKSIVMLENDGILPIIKNSKILLIGNLAKNKKQMQGSWAYYDTLDSTVDIYEGLSRYYKVDYIKGFDFNKIDKQELIDNLNSNNKYKAIFICVGESIEESGEAHSKTDIRLNKIHRKAIDIINKASNLPIVMLLINGRPLSIEKEISKCSAILECWQLGTMMGRAVADVISGNYNPSGRLTTTIARNSGQCPLYYNGFKTGRPYDENNEYTSKYIDCVNSPLYTFGYGLSYGQTNIENVKFSKYIFNKEDFLEITFYINNESKYEIEENVQIYFQDIVSKPVRPKKELLWFVKEKVKTKQRKKVDIKIPIKNLGYYKNSYLNRHIEKGDYFIFIGKNSIELKEYKITVI